MLSRQQVTDEMARRNWDAADLVRLSKGRISYPTARAVLIGTRNPGKHFAAAWRDVLAETGTEPVQPAESPPSLLPRRITGPELRAYREQINMSASDFGRALAKHASGKPFSATMIRSVEKGRRQPGPRLQRAIAEFQAEREHPQPEPHLGLASVEYRLQRLELDVSDLAGKVSQIAIARGRPALDPLRSQLETRLASTERRLVLLESASPAVPLTPFVDSGTLARFSRIIASGNSVVIEAIRGAIEDAERILETGGPAGGTGERSGTD